MNYRDYYKILDVARDATASEIKRAYRKLARKYHPDVNASPEADAKFKEAGEAYEALKDPEKRAAYDQLDQFTRSGREGGFQPPPGWHEAYQFSDSSHPGEADFSDFFETLFRRGSAQEDYPQDLRRDFQKQNDLRGRDHHARLILDIEDVFAGATRILTFRVPEIDDSGRVVQRDRNISVNIPKGVSEGQNIRLKGQGTPGSGRSPAGDLFLEVAFAPHPVFRADGRDLYLDLPVTPWEAALGGKVSMPTPGGKVEIVIPKNARTGQKLRLKGRGLPGPKPGDLYASLSIVNPPVTSDKGRELYEKMAREMNFNPRTQKGE